MPISCGHTSPLGHPFRQWPGLSSSLYLIHQVARRHASRQKQQLLALNAFISLSQHTRSDYLYIFLVGTNRSWEKLRFTLHQHKLSSPSLQNLARFKRNWEPALSWAASGRRQGCYWEGSPLPNAGKLLYIPARLCIHSKLFHKDS